MASNADKGRFYMWVRALLVAAMLTPLLLSGCSESKDAYSHVVGPSAPLILGFSSYSTPSQVRSSVPSHLASATIEDSRLDARDPRPKFDVLVLEFKGYRDRGHAGTLMVKFLNERLLSTWFYPEDHAAYLNALEQEGVSLRESNDTTIGFTRIWTYQDFHGGWYVGWEDVRIAAEMNRWIGKYS